MRSDRRHELQQNELSAQIDKVSESIKQNATLLTTIIVGAVVIIGGAIWFVNQRASAQSNAWSRLQPNPDEKDASILISQYESVAKDNVSPEITRSAYLRVADTALFELRSNRDQSEAPDPKLRKQMHEKAKASFEKIVSMAGNDLTARGRALMGLGVLAEDAGDFEKAKSYYEKVQSDAKLKETPIAREAAYRLAHMNEWNAMIEFPEPEVPPLLESPEGAAETPAGTFKPPVDISSIPTMSEIEGDKKDAPTPEDSDKDDESGDNAATDDGEKASDDESPSDTPKEPELIAPYPIELSR